MINRLYSFSLTLALMALTVTANSAMSEETLAIQIDQENRTVHLTAVSTGCTKAEHFRLTQDDGGNVTAVRERPDRCRRKAFTISFEYALDGIPLAADGKSADGKSADEKSASEKSTDGATSS